MHIYVYNINNSIFEYKDSGNYEDIIRDIPDQYDFTLVPPPDYIHKWSWDGLKWVIDINNDTDIELHQSNTWSSIKNKRLEQVTSGVLVKSVNKKFHTDETSAIQYSNVAGMIALNNYEPIEWKVMDNTWVLLTKELFIELQKAMNANTQATYVIAEQHKEAMMLLDDPSNYDFSTGWTNGVIDYN